MVKKISTLKQRHYITRHLERIRSSDIINGIFQDLSYYTSLDPSLIVAKGYVDKIECIILGQEKKRKGKESEANGMMTFKGYEYVLKMLDEAEKYKHPIITFIDTFGGDPSMESELNGQAFLISDCIRRFCEIKTPTISYIIGEGGSGGALALQVTDKSYMLENALYSVISPESCSRIIFNKRLSAGESLEGVIEDALEILQPDAEHIREVGMIDKILPEPEDGAHNNYNFTINIIKKSLVETLSNWVYINKKTDKKEIIDRTIRKLVKKRREKVLEYGKFEGLFKSLLKIIFVKEKKKYLENIKILDLDEGDFYTAELRKEYLRKLGISETKIVICEKEWNEKENKYKVAGGCGPIPLIEYAENFYACPKCGKGEYLGIAENILRIFDKDSFQETESQLTLEELINKDRYKRIEGYEKRLKAIEEKTFSREALVTGTGKINGKNVVFAISDIDFIGGSFGAVYGEKFKRAVNIAVRENSPLISICSSGGARMYEGPMSLAQMAKMNMALLDLKNKGIPFISVISEPTTGGAYASYVTQGDIIIGERGSLVEFAGPRVVLGAGFEVDKKIVCTDMLYKNKKIHHLINRNELKNILSYYIEFFYNVKYPKKRKNSGRIYISDYIF